MTTVALRIFGDDLDPREVTTLLGVEASHSLRKGETKGRSSTGEKIPAKSGTWLLNAPDRSPGDLEVQIQELFAALPSDPEVWRKLTARFECDLFCGLFMMGSNEGADLEAQTISMLASRRLAIRFDIYDPREERRNAGND